MNNESIKHANRQFTRYYEYMYDKCYSWKKRDAMQTDK